MLNDLVDLQSIYAPRPPSRAWTSDCNTSLSSIPGLLASSFPAFLGTLKIFGLCTNFARTYSITGQQSVIPGVARAEAQLRIDESVQLSYWSLFDQLWNENFLGEMGHSSLLLYIHSFLHSVDIKSHHITREGAACFTSFLFYTNYSIHLPFLKRLPSARSAILVREDSGYVTKPVSNSSALSWRETQNILQDSL